MNKKTFDELLREPNGTVLVLREINGEIERLKDFVKSFNTFRNKIYPGMVHISGDKDEK